MDLILLSKLIHRPAGFTAKQPFVYVVECHPPTTGVVGRGHLSSPEHLLHAQWNILNALFKNEATMRLGP